jgi:O-antigen ligase
LKKKDYRFEVNPFLFLSLVAFSLFLFPSIQWEYFESLYFFSIVFFILISAILAKTTDFKASLIQKWSVLSALLVSFVGIQNFYGISFLNIQVYSVFDRNSILSTIGNVNYVSDYLSSILPVLIISFFSTQNRRWRVLSYISLIASSITILWGQTRSVYLGVFISLFVLFAFMVLFKDKRLLLKKNLFYVFIGTAIIFYFFVFPPGVPENRKPIRLATERILETGVSYQENMGSMYRRMFEWRTAFEMFKSSPVYGLGWGSYKLLSSDFQTKINGTDTKYYGFYEKSEEAHSDFLQLLSETGLVGFLLWCSLMGYVLYCGVIKICKKRALMDMAYLSGWIVILIHSFTEFPLHMMPSIAIFAVFSGFLIEERPRISLPKWLSGGLLLASLFFTYVVIRVSLSDSFFAYGQVVRDISVESYQRSVENRSETLKDPAYASLISEESEWINTVLEKEKQKAVVDLTDSFYRRYLLNTNALISNPNNSYAAYEIAVLIGNMEKVTPRPPFLLFDFPDYKYNAVSRFRSVPEKFPVIGDWVYSLKLADREKMEYLYRYFRSLILSLNSSIDAAIYLNIGKSVNEILEEYERLQIENQLETVIWKDWLKFGYAKAIRLRGLDEFNTNALWDQIDLEYLEILVKLNEDKNENVLPILSHRLKIAQNSLSINWKFPMKWYNYFTKLYDTQYFTKYPIYKERMVEIFQTYASYYESHGAHFDQIERDVENPDSEVPIDRRLLYYQFLTDIDTFLTDFGKRSLEW